MSVLLSTPHRDAEASFDEAIATQRQIIRDAHTELLDLLTRRNAEVPFIARLPIETLAEIFILFEHQYRQRSFAARPFGWIIITHICRHWRNVARALPRLWSHVPMFDDEEPIKMFFALSKEISLSIIPGNQVNENELDSSIFSLLAPEAPRIRSLHLCLSRDLLEDLASWWDKPWDAPMMEAISLEWSDTEELPEMHECLGFIGGDLPALRSVSLTAPPCYFTDYFLQPTLTKLVVRHPTLPMSPEEWVDLLEELPLLEHLVLERALQDPFFRTPLTDEILEMEHLKHLELHELQTGRRCADLLDRLALPECRTLILTVRGTSTTEEHHWVFSAVASALGDCFEPKACNILLDHTRMAVQLWQDASPMFKDAWGFGSEERRKPSERPNVTIDFDNLKRRLPSDMLQTVVSALPLSDIRILRFWDPEEDRSMRPLHALPAVEALLYICPRPLDLLHELSSTPALFPDLRHLTLRSAKWHAHGEKCLEPYSDPPLSTHLDTMLAARAETGVSLQELHLQILREIGGVKEMYWLWDSGRRKDVGCFKWEEQKWRDSYPCKSCGKRSTRLREEAERGAREYLKPDVEFANLY